ncbi:MAG: exodeoxyribonuclease III [Myxococcota bacterium]
MAGELSITTWNVNSIRARLDHASEWLAEHEPDIVCLQETKVEDALFPKVPFLELGYKVTIHGGRALCGVATLTKVEPDEVTCGFKEGPADKHPRILNVLVDGVRVYNLYTPNGTSLGSEAFAYKLAWLERLREEIVANYSPDENIVVTGDFNIALEDRDVWDAAYFAGKMLFTDEEKSRLQALLDFGFTDCFRKHESGGEHYTWFDYRTGGFERNKGLRIDHVYATAPMAERCTSVVHDATPRGWDTPSDHLPVTARFSR